MSKSNHESQGVFSFFDEVEKLTPPPKPRRNVLRPPEQVEATKPETDRTATQEVKEDVMADQTLAAIAPAEHEEKPEPQILAPAPDALPECLQEKTTHSKNAETVKEGDEKKEDKPPVAKRSAGSRGRRSVKENAAAAQHIVLPNDETLFEKRYYSMGEVTAMFQESHSLIRYWESEFDILKPKKNGKGDRFFRPEDVKNLYLIYDLLRRRKFTIDGAREYLKNNPSAEERFAAAQSLQKIKDFFLELKATL